LALGIIVTGLSLGAPHAAAADAIRQGITISPTSVQKDVSSGISSSGTVQLIDDGDTSFSANISASPYAVSGENYNQIFQITPGFNDASKWFKFDKQSYQLSPHQNTYIPYTIHAPANVAPGGYYATLFATTSPHSSPGSGVQTRERVGVIFYLHVEGGSVRSAGSVASWTVPFVQTTKPLTGSVRLANTGNIDYSSTATMNIENLIGDNKTQVQTTHYVLPMTIRKVALNWSSPPMAGIFKVSGTAVIVGKTVALPAHYVLFMPLLVLIGFPLLVLLVISGLIAAARRKKRS
jgi:hypothetical protein